MKQYTGFLKWRDEKNIDNAYEDYEVDAFEELRRVYPMWTGRRDLVSDLRSSPARVPWPSDPGEDDVR